MEQQIKMIEPAELLAEVVLLREQDYHLVALTCTLTEIGLEVSYSFERDYRLFTLRFLADDTTVVESISGLYGYAFLYENEIKELFGLPIEHINVDFQNNLYKLASKTPFNPAKEAE